MRAATTRALTLRDDQGRTCSYSWQIEAASARDTRGLERPLPAGSIRELSWSPSATRPEPVFGRLTVLLHAAPISPRSPLLRARDTVLLLGALCSLLEQAPARSVRLVVFNLAQQKELSRDEEFQLSEINTVARKINNLQLHLVDYRVVRTAPATST